MTVSTEDAGKEREEAATRLKATRPQPEPKPASDVATGEEKAQDSASDSAQSPESPESPLTDKQIAAAKHLRLDDAAIEALTPEEAGGLVYASKALRRVEKRLKPKDDPTRATPATDLGDDPEPNPKTPEEDGNLSGLLEEGTDASLTAEDEEAFPDLRARKAILSNAKRLDRLERERLSSDNRRVARAAEDFFKSLGEETYGHLFGRGPTSGLDKTSSDYHNRQEVKKEASRLRKYYEQAGDSKPMSECLRLALYSKHPDAVEKAPSRGADRIDRGSVARPSGRAAQVKDRTDKDDDAQRLKDHRKRVGI